MNRHPQRYPYSSVYCSRRDGDRYEVVADRLYRRVSVRDRFESSEADWAGAAGAVFPGYRVGSRLVYSTPRSFQRYLLWTDRVQRPPLADRPRAGHV